MIYNLKLIIFRSTVKQHSSYACINNAVVFAIKLAVMTSNVYFEHQHFDRKNIKDKQHVSEYAFSEVMQYDMWKHLYNKSFFRKQRE